MIIRPFRPGDAEALAALYREAVTTIGSRDYAPDQVRAWASLAPSPGRLRQSAADGRVRLVAVAADDRPLAFADLEANGHVDFLYCAPEAAGTGLAAALYDALERRARRDGIARLSVEASEAARRFLLRRGFRVVCRRDFQVVGTPIHNYAMEKDLAET